MIRRCIGCFVVGKTAPIAVDAAPASSTRMNSPWRQRRLGTGADDSPVPLRDREMGAALARLAPPQFLQLFRQLQASTKHGKTFLYTASITTKIGSKRFQNTIPVGFVCFVRFVRFCLSVFDTPHAVLAPRALLCCALTRSCLRHVP